MSRGLVALAPYLAAFVVPTVPLTLVYALSGMSPLWGLIGGGLGLLGALSAAAVRTFTAPQAGELMDLQAELTELRAENRRRRHDYGGEHEGLRRLYEDIRREQERDDRG